MEQPGKAVMSEKGNKSAVAHYYVVQRCEDASSVVSKAVFELKTLSAFPGNRSDKELVFLIFSLSNSYEPALNSPFGSI